MDDHRARTRSWGASPEQPLECAELEIDPAAYFDLGNDHRRKPESADLALGDESLGFDGNVVLAVFEGAISGLSHWYPSHWPSANAWRSAQVTRRWTALATASPRYGLRTRMYATVRAGRSRILTLNPSGLCPAGTARGATARPAPGPSPQARTVRLAPPLDVERAGGRSEALPEAP